MKIRMSYVSNSSSSSFVVCIKDKMFGSGKQLINDDAINDLIAYGFKYMEGIPSNILFYPNEFRKDMNDFKENENINLYYDVLCNEDDVMEFLFNKKIPFFASSHYDDWFITYTGNDYYDRWPNYPNQILSSYIHHDYNPDKILRFGKPFTRNYLNGKEYTKKVFICSPYRGDIENNLKNARIYCKKAIEMNCIPIAPHLYFPQFLDDSNNQERCLGMEYGMNELKICDEVWVFGEPTEGMKKEIEIAKSLYIYIKYFDKEGKEIKK